MHLDLKYTKLSYRGGMPAESEHDADSNKILSRSDSNLCPGTSLLCH